MDERVSKRITVDLVDTPRSAFEFIRGILIDITNYHNNSNNGSQATITVVDHSLLEVSDDHKN